MLPLIAGLASGRALGAASAAWPLAGASLSGLLAMLAAGRAPRLWALAIAGASMLGGMASSSLHRQPQPAWDEMPPREARLSLKIERVYPPAPNRPTLSAICTIVRAERHLAGLIGQRIYFSAVVRRRSAVPERSELVAAMGLLERVRPGAPDGSFERSLADQGINFELSRGRVIATELPATRYRRFCGWLAGRMTELLGAGLERRPDLAALYRAMLLGRKRELSEAQRNLFLEAGAMHLFAVNGLHIGTVAIALHALFGLIRCPRLAATLLVLAALWLDVDTTGDSPSALRAFLMVAAVEVAWVLRLPANPMASLSTAALAVLLADPQDLFSASFQMSYGVMTALVALGMPLASEWQERLAPHRLLPQVSWSRLQKIRAHAQNHLAGALGIGAAAAAVGAVTGVEFFNLFVPGGLAANLVLVPPALLVIVAGVCSLACGFAGAAGAGLFFNRAAGVLLCAMTAFARAVTALPGVYFAAHYRAAWIGPAALAALLAACLAGYAGGWRRERCGFWPPFVVVAMALLFGVRYGP